MKSNFFNLYFLFLPLEPIEMWTVLPRDEYIYPNFYQCHNLYTKYKETRAHFLDITNDVKEGTYAINKKLGLHKKENMIDVFLLLDLIHTREV